MENLPDDFFTAKAAKKRGPERHLTKNYNFIKEFSFSKLDQ